MSKYVAWSFSRLTDFEQCPRKFHHKYLLKDVKEPPSEHMEYGKQVHKAIEDYINTGKPLPKTQLHMKPMIDALQKKYPTNYAELQLAVDQDWQPTDWFAKNVMARAMLDWTLFSDDGKFAVLIDWKTGKVKEELDQLELSAAMLFAHYPDLQTITPKLIFTEHKQTVPEDNFMVGRGVEDQIMEEFWERGENIQHAVRSGKWQPRKSGLCGWCPLRPDQCEFKKRRG